MAQVFSLGKACGGTCALDDDYVMLWHKYAKLQRLGCILASVTTILRAFGGQGALLRTDMAVAD